MADPKRYPKLESVIKQLGGDLPVYDKNNTYHNLELVKHPSDRRHDVLSGLSFDDWIETAHAGLDNPTPERCKLFLIEMLAQDLSNIDYFLEKYAEQVSAVLTDKNGGA